MWTKLADELLDHRKVFAAGDILGQDGPAIALGFYTAALLWSNRQLSDGYLPAAIVRSFPHVRRPIAVAKALVHAGLWEEKNGGYQIHDFHDFNFTAASVRQRRKADLARKQTGRRHGKRR